ncbi:GNAT family N-acetyltransferase [Pseudoalteromonas umbrosa]|uniref:GNAT family N-acetyltransferase n=1 Tax=Pseudoalteromonas umbrosa TaxID=3048489 RepID=UPI0024C438C6|nr:GNAT family protein [Pseudoalteromonas sp. B95]MDK1288468.1 GNAT family protein [Pseudoalteromonas sp. B95]
MQFETQRLRIRTLNSSDLHAVYQSRRDLETSKYIGKPATIEDVQKRIEEASQPWKNIDGQKLLLVIEHKVSGDFIGEMLFKFTHVAHQIGEIGYRLSPTQQRKGYAYEAASALISQLFEHFALNKITAVCATENTASWQLMEKLGMQKEGHLREHMPLDSGFADSYLYAILKKEHLVQ